MKTVRWIVLSTVLLLFGCAGVQYADQPAEAVDLAQSGESEASTRVLAKAQEWRNSGVAVQKGRTYQIKAVGRWKAAPLCHMTEADGVGLYNLFCLELVRPLVKGWSYSTLVARVGEAGAAFAVGKGLKFTADADGVLYFRMNDVDGWFWDNEGYMDVTVNLPGSRPVQPALALAQPTGPRDEAARTEGPIAAQPIPKAPPAVAPPVGGRRVALVIGNGAYREAPLRNPVHDAQDIARALQGMGFEVILRQDADLKAMEQAIDQFYRTLRKGGTGLFYYAGHGIQVAGTNYLVPVGAKIQSESDVRFEAVDAGRILGKMEDAGNEVNVVILDACRNNPFSRGFRSATQGLAKMDAPTGSLVAYSTAPGATAADGEGRNGIYTKHLLQNMRVPGLSIEDVLKRVRIGVVSETRKAQVPWESSSLTGYFYLAGPPQ